MTRKPLKNALPWLAPVLLLALLVTALFVVEPASAG
jgi:hypothetical protein